jgi:hypothetical protein
MPSLYGQSGNVTVNSSNTTGLYAIANTANVVTANISSVNTTGLYGLASNVFVPSSAQQLLNLLSNNGTVIFQLDPAYANQKVEAFATGGGSGNLIINLVGDVTGLGSTGAPLFTTLSNTGVVSGTYGNSAYWPTFTVSANGRIMTASTGNLASYLSGNVSIGNLAVTGNTSSNSIIITTGIFYANGTPFVSSSYGNANVAAFLPTYGGNITANNVTVTGNLRVTGNVLVTGNTFYTNVNTIVTTTIVANSTTDSTSTSTGAIISFGGLGVAANIYANKINSETGFFYAGNGQPYYGNATVAAYLPVNPTWTGYLTFANANAATQATSINSINANLGAYQTFANANAASQQTQINNLVTQANANVAAYLLGNTRQGNIQANTVNLGPFGNFLGNPNYSGRLNIQGGTGSFGYGANLTLTSNLGADSEGYAYTTIGSTVNNQTGSQPFATGTPAQTILTGNILVPRTAWIGNAWQPNNRLLNATTPQAALFEGNVSFNFDWANKNPNSTVQRVVFYNPVTITGFNSNLNVSGGANLVVGDGLNGGNITVFSGGYYLGDGSKLTGIVSTYGNTQVAAYLPTYTGNLSPANLFTNNIRFANGQPYNFGSTYSNANVAAYLITNTGNIAAGNIFSNNYLYANGVSILTGIGGTYSNVNVAAYIPTDPTITGIQANVGVLYLGNISTNANLGAFQTYANATFITTGGSYGNANVATYLPTYTGNLSAGNIFSNNYLYANGVSILTNIPGTYGNANVATYLPTYLPTYTGNLGAGNINVTGTINAQSFNAGLTGTYYGSRYRTSNINIEGPTIQPYSGSGLNIWNTLGGGGGSTSISILCDGYSGGSGTVGITAKAAGIGNGILGGFVNITATPYSVTGAGGNLTLTSSNLIIASSTLTRISGPLTSTGNIDTTAYFTGNGYYLTGITTGSTYGNANVAAYLPTDPTITGIQANVGVLYLGNISTNANLGAFETYANVTFSTQANAASQQTNINSINANLGAYQTYGNVTFSTVANAASQQTQIDTNTTGIATINANLGAYQTYANTTFVTTTNQYSNVNVAAYLPTYTGDLNGVLRSGNVYSTTTATITGGTGVFVVSGASANVYITGDSYIDLTGQSGIQINNTPQLNISDGNLNVYKNAFTPTTSGYIYADNNIRAGGNIISNNYLFANGVSILGSSTGYGNTQVAAYLDGSTSIVKNSTGTLTLTGNTASLILSATAVGGIGGPVVYAANSSNIASQAGVYSTTGFFWANGTAYSTGSGTYGNTQVAAYLPTYSGQLGGTVVVPNFSTANAQITGGNASVYNSTATNRFVGSNFDAANSAGGQLRNAGGTAQLQWGGGGGNNISVDVAININPANAQVSISPTGTGSVDIKPAGHLDISPPGVGFMNNVVIGNATPTSGIFTTLQTSGNITANAGAYFLGSAAKLTSLTGVATGTYGNDTTIPTIVVDATGRITQITTNVISGGGSYGNSNVAAYLAGTISVGNILSTSGYFWANGTAYSTGGGSTYGNTEVAAYLPTYTGSLDNSSTIQTINANLGAYQTYANVTFSTVANAASQQTQIDGILNGTTTLANVLSTGGYFWANGTPYSTGGSSGVTQIVAGGNITIDPPGGTGIVTITATGSPGPAGPGFSGNLAGNILYDSINERIIANAFPLSTANISVPNNTISRFVVYDPVYTNGQLQQPPLANATVGGTGIVSTSAQSIGFVQTANIAMQSGYGFGSQNRDTTNFLSTMAVTPVTANGMSTNDRVRGGVFTLDYVSNAINWGTMSTASQNASPLAALNAFVNLNGAGSIGAAVGGNYGVQITPPATGTNANVQYATGLLAFTNLFNTAGTTGKANVVYSRGVAPFITGFSSNLTVQNAIGLHTYSGWAGSGTVGSANNPTTGRWALLNEDANTAIQTNGNVLFSNAGVAGSTFTVNSRFANIASTTTFTGVVNIAGTLAGVVTKGNTVFAAGFGTSVTTSGLNLQATFTSSNIAQIGPVSGSITYSATTTEIIGGVQTVRNVVGNTMSGFQSITPTNAGLNSLGDNLVAIVSDQTNGVVYRITYVKTSIAGGAGSPFAGVTIERLI